MTRILIVPGELRTAASALRNGRDAMIGVMARAATPMPAMPADLRARAQGTVARFNYDLTEQRNYMEEEAFLLQDTAYLVTTMDAEGLAVALDIREEPGTVAGEPWLGEVWEPAPPPPATLDPMDILHSLLDIVGFVPGVGTFADLVNAGLYSLEGDELNAALAAFAAIPLAGDASRAAQQAAEAGQAVAEGLATELVDGVRPIDAILEYATLHRGDFPKTSYPGEVLVRRDPQTGAVTHYQVYGEDGLPIRRVDVTGAAHGVPTPHVVEFTTHVNSTTGEPFVIMDGRPRPANPDEIPSP